MFEGVSVFFQENQSLLTADPASDVWKAYVDYVDEIVLDGFFTAIECSLKYLLENTGNWWSLSSGHGAVVLPKGGFPLFFAMGAMQFVAGVSGFCWRGREAMAFLSVFVGVAAF